LTRCLTPVRCAASIKSDLPLDKAFRGRRQKKSFVDIAQSRIQCLCSIEVAKTKVQVFRQPRKRGRSTARPNQAGMHGSVN
jgi:hypothetical protein